MGYADCTTLEKHFEHEAIHITLPLRITMVLFGLWNIGQGAWIYLKAELAQHLLEKAWTRTLQGEP